jgi:tryptophanase
MASKKQRAVRPLDAALARLQALAMRAVQPHRMAREVDIIVGEWRAAEDAEVVRERLGELHEMLVAGVADAEEQISYVDAEEPAAAKQAQATLAALVATLSAVQRAANAPQAAAA